ncbi:MAG: low-specificity L-threonine aldolase [bacterium]|nr:low-specificity L-threonine aldolase [bacterium]
MDRIDFRSDTVSWPTPAMREAMAHARVGDDVYEEDPTVRRLEDLAAERVGKEAGLFVASGTMGNLAATLVHAGRGDEAILGRESHVFQWEAGGMASLGGVMPHTLENDDDGRMDLDAVEGAVREDDPHLPRTRLLLVENTFGGCGGTALPPEYFAAMREIAERHGLAVHLDGARLFNAAVAQGIDASKLTADVDSVTFCLSKGLCAPVGSVLCGSNEFVAEARRARKRLGGGMRQAGVLAAAGVIALESMISRLAEDHENARLLAEELSGLKGVRVEPSRVQTNIVHFELDASTGLTPEELGRRLQADYGIGMSTYPGNLCRAVTHYWLGKNEVRALVGAVGAILDNR